MYFGKFEVQEPSSYNSKITWESNCQFSYQAMYFEEFEVWLKYTYKKKKNMTV